MKYILVCLVFFATLQPSPSSDEWMDNIDWMPEDNMEQEEFRERNNTIVLTTVGESITMDCRVERRGIKMVSLVSFFSDDTEGDFQVSWLRLTNSFPELLTVGLTTYSGDTRVRSAFVPPTNWRLSISNLTKQDSRICLCQLSSHQPRVLITTLTVDGKNHAKL